MIFMFFKAYIRVFTYEQIITFGRIPIKSETHSPYKKIHEAIAPTATAPLLNLNLNYEKLRDKVK